MGLDPSGLLEHGRAGIRRYRVLEDLFLLPRLLGLPAVGRVTHIVNSRPRAREQLLFLVKDHLNRLEVLSR